MSKKNGFSLIELLVVITIIGILATIGMMSYRTANQKARDNRRLADIQAIQSALEVYRSTNGTYPTGNMTTIASNAEFRALFTNGSVPTDPGSTECNYTYTVGNPAYTYTLSYCLETDGVPASAPIVVHNP